MSKPSKQVQKMFKNNEKAVKVAATAVIGTTIALSCYSFASADTVYDLSSYRGIGYMMKVDEVGVNGNGGTIGFVKSDTGGISYGLCQMATNAGTPDAFVKWLKTSEYKEYYEFFKEAGNPKAGTTAFGEAWTNAYNSNNRGFEKAQMGYINDVLVPAGYNRVKEKYGIDMKTSRARTEMLYSTVIQYGAQGICDLFDHIDGIDNDTDDETFVEKFETAKYNSVGNYKFMYCDNDVRAAARERFTREKEELLKLAKEEASGTLDEYTEEETITSEDSGKSATELLEDEADKYDGVTYKMGAKQPEKTGTVDCSGLVSKIANDLGCDVDGMMTNALKYSQDSEKISRDELQPGDLVFWNDHTGTAHSSVCHIAIYLGGDTLLNSSPSTNGVGTLKLSSLQDNASTTYTYGRYAPLTEAIEKNASDVQEILDKVEFEDVIDIGDDSEIEKVAEDAQEKVDTTMAAIEDGTISDDGTVEVAENDSNKDQSDEFDSIIDDSETDTSKDTTKEETTTEDKSENTKDEDKSTVEETKDNETESKDEKSEDNTSKEETATEDKSTEESDTSKSSEGVLYVGDSYMEQLKDEIKSRGGKVVAKVGISANAALNDTSYFGEALIDQMPEDSDDINTIVINIGINNITSSTNEDDVLNFIKAVQEKYPGKEIKVIKTTPVGEQYSYLDKDKVNEAVDSLNDTVKDYADKQDDVNVIDATSDFVNEDGYLEDTKDGLHISSDNNEQFLDNIENAESEKSDKSTDKETVSESKEETTTEDKSENTKDEDKSTVEETKDNETESKDEKSEDNTSKEETTQDSQQDDNTTSEDSTKEEQTSEVEQSEETTQEPSVEETQPVQEPETTLVENTSADITNDQTSTQQDEDQAALQQIQNRLENNIFNKLFK